MPNWVTNQISMEGDEGTRKKVVDFLKGENGDVDFNNIVEMPIELRATEAGSRSDEAWDYYESKVLGNDYPIEKRLEWEGIKRMGIKTVAELLAHMEKENPDILNYGKSLHELHSKYGCHDWYNWACKYWGTKWNACEPCADDYEISFNTAWSAVPVLIQNLSCLFPTITFTYAWADEDFGCNLGRVKMKAGDIIDHYLPEDGSKEAYALAEEILGYSCDWDEEEEEEESEEE